MVKGPAGYGRYDDDLTRVACPYARTWKSPCVARDGRLALSGVVPPYTADEAACNGCALSPEYLTEELAGEYEPARELLALGDPVTQADRFAEAVREATEPGREE